MIVVSGLILSALAAFVLSLFHMALAGFSKIGLSGYLEERDKSYRHAVLKHYEEIYISVEFWRTFFLLAFAVYVFVAIPRAGLRPLWLFLGLALAYGLLFEALPRLVGTPNKERLVASFLPSYKLFLVLSTPLLVLYRWLCAREEGEEEAEDEREAGDEEIETFIDSAKEEGIIEKGGDELLRSVVEFGDIVVREIMTPRVDMVCIRKDATVQKLRNLIITEKYSRIPVYKDRIDNIEGIVIAKDLLAFSEAAHDKDPIDPFLRPVIFVPESMMIAELLKEFQKEKQKMALVVDEHGGVSGLVTMEDLLEEIVGEIQDEYDTEEAQITVVSPTEYIVSGDVKVEELEDILDQELAEDDYLTASGLLTHHLGRLPHKGETAEIKGLSVEVLEVDQKRIKKIRIKRPAPATEADSKD
ncbi:MAG: hemolysin family protein [Candidatus Aminicenantes bacterium]|nr:hemolysin family protein [Candidatus Aminicenantes bacterium]